MIWDNRRRETERELRIIRRERENKTRHNWKAKVRDRERDRERERERGNEEFHGCYCWWQICVRPVRVAERRPSRRKVVTGPWLRLRREGKGVMVMRGEGLFYWVRLIKRANKCRGRCVGPTDVCSVQMFGCDTWRPLIEGFPKEAVRFADFVWHRRLSPAPTLYREINIITTTNYYCFSFFFFFFHFFTLINPMPALPTNQPDYFQLNLQFF